tara:strand:+ start:10260 stop:10856 length:597 start_codon:yes stop_codon:yes gene_type:complete
MILNLIKLGIEFLLKTSCQNIVIKKIEIEIENKIFKGKVKKLFIEAEKIIYRNMHLDHAEIIAFNLNIDFNRKSKFLKINNFNSDIKLYLNNENLKNIINHKTKTESEIRKKIREFTIQNNVIEKISFVNKLILFDMSKDENNYKKYFRLDFKNNYLTLLDINSNENLLIEFDKNIIFNSLKIDKDFLIVELASLVRI